jgi:hypothetical protein
VIDAVTLTSYALVVLGFVFIPGPATLLTISRAASSGTRVGIAGTWFFPTAQPRCPSLAGQGCRRNLLCARRPLGTSGEIDRSRQSTFIFQRQRYAARECRLWVTFPAFPNALGRLVPLPRLPCLPFNSSISTWSRPQAFGPLAGTASADFSTASRLVFIDEWSDWYCGNWLSLPLVSLISLRSGSWTLCCDLGSGCNWCSLINEGAAIVWPHADPRAGGTTATDSVYVPAPSACAMSLLSARRWCRPTPIPCSLSASSSSFSMPKTASLPITSSSSPEPGAGAGSLRSACSRLEDMRAMQRDRATLSQLAAAAPSITRGHASRWRTLAVAAPSSSSSSPMLSPSTWRCHRCAPTFRRRLQIRRACLLCIRSLSRSSSFKRPARTPLLAGAALLLLCRLDAHALESMAKAASRLSADALWAAIDDFCGINRWHPAVEKCELSADGKMRTLSLRGSGTSVEALVKMDPAARSYTYSIVSGTLPVANYDSTISVSADGTGSMVTWIGKYDARRGADADAKKAIELFYELGLKALTAKVGTTFRFEVPWTK